jgi:hypothetical protein
MGPIWEPLQEHSETLKHVCGILSMVSHDGFIQRMLYGQEAFLVVAYKKILSIRN